MYILSMRFIFFHSVKLYLFIPFNYFSSWNKQIFQYMFVYGHNLFTLSVLKCADYIYKICFKSYLLIFGYFVKVVFFKSVINHLWFYWKYCAMVCEFHSKRILIKYTYTYIIYFYFVFQCFCSKNIILLILKVLKCYTEKSKKLKNQKYGIFNFIFFYLWLCNRFS